MSGTALANQLNIKATALYHSGDYRQAIQVWQEALQADPDNQRAKEGIRMASLLLDEAQASLDAPQLQEPAASPESPETIAKVREGIQRVRDFLSSGRYLDAMEVCQSLLHLAPRSEAVREVLEEAREAYEAQPFIDEHLEIARQLFIQERLDESSAELQKIFFLNANHPEARKLQAKIQQLRQKLAPVAGGEATDKVPAGFEVGSETVRLQAPPDFGDSITLPEEPPSQPETTPQPAEAQPPAQQGETEPEDALNQDWEAELAQLNLGPVDDTPTAPGAEGESDAEPIPLMDPSENPTGSPVSAPGAREPEKESASESAELLDLPDMSGDLSKLPASIAGGEALESPAVRPAVTREKAARAARPAPVPPRRRASFPLGKILLALVGMAVLAGAGLWLLGDRSASGSGQGGGAGAPPNGRAPARAPRNSPGQDGAPANVGLSGSGSKTGNAAAGQAAGQAAATGTVAPALTPEEIQSEIAGHFSAGRSSLSRGDYSEAVTAFSKVLELDPANIEAKSYLDQAASKVLEQKRLEEDLQTAKEYFLEKDYESALRKFYRLPKDKRLGEVELFIRNAWYNWAVMSMKGGNCPEAIQRLDEALNSDPGDEEAVKLREVAEHYRDRPKDKVFYAYADRLTYRTLNQK